MPTDLILFDTFTLAAIVAELNRVLEGARVQKIRQTSPVEFGVALYNGAFGVQHLFLSADPRLFRVHLTQMRRDPLPTASGFLQVARKWLDGAYFVSANMEYWDRILRLLFR